MIQVKEQAFAAIEESETKEVVVDERQDWADDDIQNAESAMSLFKCDPGT